jgi:hypothetical protein
MTTRPGQAAPTEAAPLLAAATPTEAVIQTAPASPPGEASASLQRSIPWTAAALDRPRASDVAATPTQRPEHCFARRRRVGNRPGRRGW